MKIAVLYICTGKYNQFFDDFYKTAKTYLLPTAQKVFFVWSDDSKIAEGKNDVVFYQKAWAGFPADSLYRFELFKQAEDKVKGFDYVYYFNANTLFVKKIGDEILPDESGLIAAEWPIKHRFLKSSVFYHYERNKKSLAFIPPFKGPYVYYAGFLNGGTVREYYMMVDLLIENIRKDAANDIYACSYDESHLNNYLHYHKCKKLNAGYCWPEEWNFGSIKEAKIILRDKVRLDPYFNKGRKIGFAGRLHRVWYLLSRAVSWYF